MPDERIARRDLENAIADLKREKDRVEVNVQRMEINQKRAEEMAAKRAEEADAEKEDSSPKRAKKNVSAKRARSDDGLDKDDNDDKDDKGDKDRKEKKDEKDEKGEKDDNDNKDGKEEGKNVDKDEDEQADKDAPDRKNRGIEEHKTRKADPRGRAMFGKLLGHLKSAKTRLESEKGWRSAALNRKAQERLEHRMTLQKMGIQEYTRTQYEEQRSDELAKLSLIDKTIDQKELLLLEMTLDAHYTHMTNFIRTQADPCIFYLPAKHIDKTENLLDATRSQIENKISSLKGQLQPPPQDGETDARASAAAAVNAAVEASVERREEEGKPSIARDAPNNPKEAEGAEKVNSDKEDNDDDKSDKKDDDRDDKSDKEESKSDKEGPAAKRRRTDDDKDEASDDKASDMGSDKVTDDKDAENGAKDE